jgi:hypothetical protein
MDIALATIGFALSLLWTLACLRAASRDVPPPTGSRRGGRLARMLVVNGGVK